MRFERPQRTSSCYQVFLVVRAGASYKLSCLVCFMLYVHEILSRIRQSCTFLYFSLSAISVAVLVSLVDKSVYVFIKPLPILFIAIMALGIIEESVTRRLIVAALFLSACGDVSLSLNFSGNFALGLMLFFVAHLVFTFLFLSKRSFSVCASMLSCALLFWFVSLGLLIIPLVLELGTYLAVAVAAYIIAIGSMAIAGQHWAGSKMVPLGALMFCLSDSLLGYDRFVQPIPARDVLVMGTYYIAQGLIFLGIRRGV